MAKSIRSKRKRKMRAIKRTQNAPKELKRLKKTLGLIADDDPNLKRYKFNDVRDKIKKQTIDQATGVEYIPKGIKGAEAAWSAIMEDVKKRKEEKMKQRPGYQEDEEDEKTEKEEEKPTMDVDRDDLKINPKTLKNKHGNYPVWMNQRQLKNLKSVKTGGKVTKKGKKKIAW
ncbi:Protein LLP-like [Holothuria leucospilota]|uniref:Protein LLP-like n=1 Tax=Holothuria leucospilota TaxID=206669 RepID=A0A9Q1CLA4_HOLLE|nr:Protein LLP-like [Holothuria leucospilota]